ncbi:MAG: hypothetical protein ACRDI3_01565 [Actinomycetota bacterium]
MRRQALSAAAAVLFAVGALGAPASAATGPDLSVGMTGPSQTPNVGDAFDITLSVVNVGSATATEATLGLYLGEAIRIDGVVASDPSDACSEPYPGQQECDLGTMGPGAVSSFTFHVTRTMAREFWTDAWVATTGEEGDFTNNYAGLEFGPDKSNQADVAVTGSVPEEPDVNAQYDSTFVVTNRGPGRAHDVRLDVTLPEKNTFVSATSSDSSDTCALHEETYDEEGFEGGPYVFRSVRCTLGTMAFAEQATVTVTQVRDNAYELWSSAYVATSSYDNNYENDWAELVTAGHPSVTSNLTVTHTAPGSTPLVGDGYEVAFTVGNAGPVAAPDTQFWTYAPDTFDVGSVTAGGGHSCAEDQWGGIACDLGTMDVGETETIIMTLTRTRARETWISGWLDSPNYDPDYENDYVEFVIEADTSNPADVDVKTEGPVDPEVGSDFTTTTTVTNNGPDTARSVGFHHTIAEWSSFVSVTSSDPSDVCELHEETYDDDPGVLDSSESSYVFREVRCDLGDMAAGEKATIEVTATRDEGYDLWASVWVETASYDENYENDWAEWNSSGNYGGCFESEDGKAISCEIKGGADGARDAVEVTAGSRRDSTVRSGAGDDTVVVDVPTGGKRDRRIVVRAGRGDDLVTVNVAPGARNATIIVRTGAGNDTVDIDSPRPGDGIRIKVLGGLGRDKLLGGEDRDLMWGGLGNDRLEGSGGNDRLAGGPGRDTCVGGAGRDERIGC